MAFLGLFLTSCQKEKDNQIPSVVNTQGDELAQQKKYKARILHFIDKLNKDGESSDVDDRDAPLTPEELAFGSEAVLNLYYSRFEDRFQEMDYAESELSVPLTNGTVSNNDLTITYASIEQAVTDHLSVVSYAEKKVNYVDVIVSEVSATEATIRVKTAIGGVEVGPSDPNDPSAQPPYFDEGWRCGAFQNGNTTVNAVGHCDGSEPEWDAAKLFKKTLNENFRLDHPFPLIYHGVYGFQVDSDVSFFLWDNTYSKYYSATYNGTLDGLCLSVDDMNHYYGDFDTQLALMETGGWQLDNPNFFPGQEPETNWRLKNVESVETKAFNFPIVQHVAKVVFMKRIIIYDDGGDNYTGDQSSSMDALSWVNNLLN